MANNTLYYGDNLDILGLHIKDESVDLIYLDPPFNSNSNYNILFAEQDGSRAAAQIKAFGDTWRWDTGSSRAYRDIVEGGGKVSQVMQAFHTFLGENDMLAYLAMMAPRLVALRKVLKPTGSIYLHCDPTASHYLKLLMDGVFGFNNYRNEIAWCYKSRPISKRHFSKKHDIILFYSKTETYTFDWEANLQPLSASTISKYRREDTIGKYRLVGRGITGSPIKSAKDVDPKWEVEHPELVTRDYLREGYPLDDWWDINIINQAAKERLGYPTQKPEELLNRIILASCPEGGTVLDPFAGCGTTISVAEQLKRNWIGIDITHLAIALIKNRLTDVTSGKAKYAVIGEPVTLPDAEELATNDKYQFQWWALGLVGARPADQKKGADKGIDGRLYFHDEADETKTKQIILSVKGGKLKPDDIRAVKGVIEREHAHIGVLISMEEPTKSMKADAAGGGFYHSPSYNQDYPALQILTIEELLNGKRIDMPPQQQVSTTFKKAPRAKEQKGRTLEMPL